MLDKYIEHLLNDLRICATQAREQFVPHQSESEQGYSEDVPVMSISSYFDLEPDALPPNGQLSRIQVRAIVSHLMLLLHTVNVYPVFPSGLPFSKRYGLLRQLWNRPMLLRFAEKQPVDFCMMETNTCPYGSEYCFCANYSSSLEDI